MNYTTNRILEIPQVVKYATELNNKSYRLKILKGTTYYVPSGFEADGVTPKFSIRTTTADNYVQNNFWSDYAANVEMVFIYFKDDVTVFNSQARVGSNVTSGETAPTQFLANCALWYDTKNNYVKFTDDSGANWYNASLPLLIGSPLNTISDSQPINGWVNGVTQVFNGIGFIGSTMFSLPGIKYAIANGRNETLLPKTDMYETTGVKTFTFSSYRANNKIVIIDNELNIRGDAYYDGDINLYYNNGSKSYHPIAVLGYATTQTTAPYNIISLKQCMVDSFVTANASNFSVVGESIISGMGMPSNKYDVLTFGASGTSYIAPANGYFTIDTWTTPTETSYFNLVNANSGVAILLVPNQGHNYEQRAFVPCKAGDRIVVAYTNLNLERTAFRFVYAQGNQ